MKKKIDFLLRENAPSRYCTFIKNFGWGFALKRFVLKNLALGTDYRINYYNPFIQKQVTRYFADVLAKYQGQPVEVQPISGKIPVFAIWWQGEETMPEVVKLCIASQRQAFSDERFDYYLITKDNLADFLTLPQYIWDRVADETINLTHLSDIIRVGLLKEHGGMYLDATFFLPNTLPDHVFERSFFTLKKKNSPEMLRRHVAQGRWMCNFWFIQSQHVLFSFMYDAYLTYYRKQTILMDFYLLDYLLDLAYRGLSEVREQFDTLPLSPNTTYQLLDKLNEQGTLEDIEDFMTAGMAFKLSYKQDLFFSREGSPTRYALLLNRYGLGREG